MIKIIATGLILLVGTWFLAPKILPGLKNKTIEAVNPAAKEKRLLGAYSSSLNQFQEEVSSEEFKNLPEDEKMSKMQQFLKESGVMIKEIENANEKGNLQSSISNLVNKITLSKDSGADSSSCIVSPSKN